MAVNGINPAGQYQRTQFGAKKAIQKQPQFGCGTGIVEGGCAVGGCGCVGCLGAVTLLSKKLRKKLTSIITAPFRSVKKVFEGGIDKAKGLGGKKKSDAAPSAE